MSTIVQYLPDAKRQRYAERSVELAVAMANGEPDAFGRFVLFHRPIARYLSKWLQVSCGVDADDAAQIGMLGLIEAASRFDPKRGYQFSTYANYWFRQTCQRYRAKEALFIHVPIRIADSLFLVRRHLDKLAAKFGPAFAKEELERRCMADDSFFGEWRGFERALNVRSLSDRREPEYRQAHQLVAPGFQPLDQQVSAERVAAVRAAIDRLRPRDRRFVRLRYGINGAPQTLAKIGRSAGLTRERVRQILKRAEDQLRRCLYRELDLEVSVVELPTNTNAESFSDSVVDQNS